MLGYIYHITNILNGKKYIGKTINLKHRLECHFSDLKLNKHHSIKLQRAYNKYGEENFKVSYYEVVVENDDELSLLEMQEIQKYDSCNSGYNITLGGEGHISVIPFNERVLIHSILQDYDGVVRQIANYYKCDHSVINIIKTESIYEKVEFNENDKKILINKIGISEQNKKENYIKHNEKKLNKEQCFEIYSVIFLCNNYNKTMAEIFNVSANLIQRLKKGIIYKDYLKEFNNLSMDEKENLKNKTFEKYNVKSIYGKRSRHCVKNALTQEQVNYILDNINKMPQTQIAKHLNISVDRVRGVKNGTSYKDLIEVYFKTHIAM